MDRVDLSEKEVERLKEIYDDHEVYYRFAKEIVELIQEYVEKHIVPELEAVGELKAEETIFSILASVYIGTILKTRPDVEKEKVLGFIGRMFDICKLGITDADICEPHRKS